MSLTRSSRSVGSCRTTHGADRVLDYPQETFGARETRLIDAIVEVRPR